MDNEYREVDFERYCANCKYQRNEETDSPCDECLEEPVNLYSTKPTKWEQKGE